MNWTPQEDELLRQNLPVPNRTKAAIRSRKFYLGISHKSRWTEQDIELLKQGIVPKGHTLHACYVYAHKHNLGGFRPQVDSRPKNLSKDQLDAMETMIRNGASTRQVAAAFNVSHQYPLEFARSRKLTFARKQPKDKRGKTIYYKGRNYVLTYHKGSVFWRGTSKERKTLERVLYEEHNGPIPKDHFIVHQNGDPMDLNPSNLIAVTRQELGHRTIQKLGIDTMNAILALGHLTRSIKAQHKRSQRTI